MTTVFHFENLLVWQESIKLAKEIYSLSKSFPKDEIYGLTNQLRRAIVSVSLNIAEGKGRYSKKEFVQYLYIARGSTFEVITCLKIALELNYIETENYEKLANKLSSIISKLSGLINSIK